MLLVGLAFTTQTPSESKDTGDSVGRRGKREKMKAGRKASGEGKDERDENAETQKPGVCLGGLGLGGLG